MHPVDHYPTIQRGLEELRRQAERERLVRAARLRKLSNLGVVKQFIAWVGIHLVRWGKKQEHTQTLRKTLDSVPASPHH